MIGILKQRTPAEYLATQVHPGKARRRVTGGYIDDLAVLGKAIWLCVMCSPKFNAARYKYIVKMSLPTVRGACDGCRQHGLNTMFVPHQHKDGWNGNV